MLHRRSIIMLEKQSHTFCKGYTAMAEIIKPLWSFVKIHLNIQWSLFTENKHNVLLHVFVIYYLST